MIEIILDQRYNRSLPECIEDHLNQNLDQDDYEQLRLAAQEYPAIRPWISDCIKNGALTYRDAEPLFMRINQHIAAREAWVMPPPLNSQQQLLLMLQSGAQPERPMNEKAGRPHTNGGFCLFKE